MLRMEGTMGLRLESKQSTQLVNNCTFAHQLDFCLTIVLLLKQLYFCLTIVLLLAALDLPHFMPSSCKSTWGAPRIRLGVATAWRSGDLARRPMAECHSYECPWE